MDAEQLVALERQLERIVRIAQAGPASRQTLFEIREQARAALRTLRPGRDEDEGHEGGRA